MPCCNDVVAKSPIWLVLLLHHVVKARSWIVLNSTHCLPVNPPLPSGLLAQELSITISTQLPSPAPTGHDIFVLLTSKTITKSSQSYFQSVPVCQASAISITQAQATLPFSTALTAPAPTWAPCFPWVLSNELSLQLPLANQNHTSELAALYPEPFSGSHMIWMCCKTLRKGELWH